jgi:hypothetical protein
MMQGKKPFKTCPMCGTQWADLDEFLDDPSLEICGYMADFGKLERGLFFFNHRAEDCHTTLTIFAGQFISLYNGTTYTERRTGKEGCPGYCLEKDQLDRCDAFCECAFNREVIQVIKARQGKHRAR